MAEDFKTPPRLIVHIVFRFDYGGLENGVTNVINGLSNDSFCHAVVALTEATDFKHRLEDNIPVYCLGKKPGKDLKAYFRLYKLLRTLRPTIVHTRNMGTMDCTLVAFLARVPIRIHGEHGWDIFDPDGTNPRYRRMRILLSRFVKRFVTVSEDLQRWLVGVVGIPEYKVQHICNGVDIERFRPRVPRDSVRDHDDVVIGSVTRFSSIKDPLNLVEAFIALKRGGAPGRLVMIGDGELHQRAVRSLANAGLDAERSLPGSRDDIPAQLHAMDIFVLGSLREGISNTILEAMASGLPVVATDTGGNKELIASGVNGVLVPPGDRKALCDAIAGYVHNRKRCLDHGRASRDRVVSLFSIERMIDEYRSLYENVLKMQSN
jgi:sugar transferase (PEP-CTERM/EpsH1 system associated)